VSDARKTTAEKLQEKNGITFWRINSEKFKTNRVDLFFMDNLEKSRAAGNAIIPSVLKRGCKSFPTTRDLELKLESLYGSDVDGGSSKKGETQIVSFHMSHIADKYTLGGEKLFEECFELLMCIMENPVIEDQGFKSSVFRLERDNLVDYIRSRINDKMRFSLIRCMEEMCSGEPFAIPDEGTEEDALILTPQKTYALYQELLSTCPVNVYLSGSIDDGSAAGFMDKLLQMPRKDIKKVVFADVAKEVKEIKRVDESMDVNQGKLCMGFRTNVQPGSPDYFPLVVYNGLLGGDIHSKLFQNVREKASLCYYAQSVLEKFKGLMVIMSGIEAENRKKAEELILKQFEDMKKGDFRQEELDATKRSIETGLKSMQDSQGAIVDFFLSQHITGDDGGEDFESMYEKIKAVTSEDVVRVANGIKLDTIYFLKPDGEGSQERRHEHEL